LTKTFVSRYNLRAFLGLHTKTPSVRETTPSLGNTLAGSTISGLTHPSIGDGSAKPPPVAAGKGIDSRVENPHFNEPLFGSYKTSALKCKAIRDKIKDGSIPALPSSKQDGAKPMCLA
jgi:hypothetical protein